MNRIQLIDAETLYYKPLAHPRMLIDGILADGLAVMAGDSKIGKSWMVLWLCLQISKGEPVWGIPTRKTDVVYLALEDREWRIQQRMQELIEAPPENLHFGFSCGQLGSELESQIEAVLQDYPSTGLIFIDTLQMIRDNVSGKVNAYAQDYRDLSSLKKIADNHGICIFLVHHTRKSKNPEDSFDNINGSTGILGAADFTIVLDKQSRMDDEAGFLLTGRDIEQCERVIRFDKARCRWVMQGTAAQLAAQRRVAEYEAEPIVKTLRVLLQQGDGTWSGYSKNLMEMGQRYAHTELAPTSQALAKRITELEPMLWERDAVKHWMQDNGSSAKRHCFRQQRIDNTVADSSSAQLSLRHKYC